MTHTPYFLWDYNISEADLRRLLRDGSQVEKQWIIARILTSAKFDDIWKYLELKDVVEHFPQLKLKSSTKNNWKRALKVWGYAV